MKCSQTGAATVSLITYITVLVRGAFFFTDILLSQEHSLDDSYLSQSFYELKQTQIVTGLNFNFFYKCKEYTLN